MNARAGEVWRRSFVGKHFQGLQGIIFGHAAFLAPFLDPEEYPGASDVATHDLLKKYVDPPLQAGHVSVVLFDGEILIQHVKLFHADLRIQFPGEKPVNRCVLTDPQLFRRVGVVDHDDESRFRVVKYAFPVNGSVFECRPSHTQNVSRVLLNL